MPLLSAARTAGPTTTRPALPAALTVRTRHHMRVVGSALAEKVDAETVCWTVGEEKLSWSSIWMV